ncbi:MAG: transcription-repair coupling factor [Thermoleophilales bacterium]|nr:transcription-repair coupling factor [Thermoleophilales bacterium]
MVAAKANGAGESAGSGTAGTPVRAEVSASLRPALIAALLEDDLGLEDRPALIVTPDDRSAREMTAALGAFLGNRSVRSYPSRGTGYASQVSPPPHLTGLRIDALDSFGRDEQKPPIVVASAIALAESVPDASLRPAGFRLAVGEERDPAEIAGDLVAAGYERVDQVQERGQFAVRGGILDVFSATEDRATRIDFFGDEIESMRWFSTFTQRSLGQAEAIELAPAAELDVEHRELAELAIAEARENETDLDIAEALPLDSFRAPLDLVPVSAAIILTADEEIEPALKDHWEDVTTAMHAEDAKHLYEDVAVPLGERAALVLKRPGEGEQALRAMSAETPARNLKEAEAELRKLVDAGYRTVVAFDSRGEAERARYGFDRLDTRIVDSGAISAEPGVSLVEARLAEGFVSPRTRVAVLPFRRLLNRRRRADEKAPEAVRGRLTFSELRVGDFVVHEDHGVARFAGFETREVGGITRDYLYLEYKGEDRVYVPTDQFAKLSRYSGGGGAPTLSALGGKKWLNMRARARDAASEIAGELVNLYAERKTRKGHAFSPDSEWQMELEANFPWRETADQIEAIEAVKADMESLQPMDRLVCGDVGYGKTEVAIRAAVKAASDGKQVMVLAPTTILAQQHLGTFRERLADLPFRVDGVSRLRKPAEVRQVIGEWAEGKVDVLIGTHRLLSRDVRAKDLGLIVVDEEQRFGVKQKELLRQMKLKVDVLSMSATPIPRTLQMSMSGLRDISVIETPPEGRRPVRTYVGPWDEGLVERAIKREIDRKGQIFFLHNRVESLDEAAESLRALVPGIRVQVAHGQMEDEELESAMLNFLRGEADCLVATTIIESGIDIPAANTLIVDRADHLGLAQAYQIRGRVGRSRERAFAYLLYPSEESLTSEASTRLATLADHTELGSGFRIAMRDLDIRGAGNLLGDEQSGHVAAVGFELYCQLIDEAVADLAGRDDSATEREPVRFDIGIDAYLPASYVPFEAAKIDLHRRIAAARRPGELRQITDEMKDRFGDLPVEVENLITLQQARINLGTGGADQVQFRGGKLTVSGIELDSDGAAAVREAVPGTVYEWRSHELSLRVDSDPAKRLATVSELGRSVADVGMLRQS